jgi:hypothetical protein
LLSDAQRFWETIVGKVRWVAEEVSRNTFRCERYEVTTAPNGTKMGVTLPFGSKEISIPYSKEVSTAQVGDQVLVVWWGSMSNAKVYYFANGYNGVSLRDCYPVGSYYWSDNRTDPAELFGGRWERVTGVFLLAATDGGSSGASQAAGRTGGDATHAHTTGGHTLTVNEIPAHNHAYNDSRQVLTSTSADGGAVQGATIKQGTGTSVTYVLHMKGDVNISRQASTANRGGGTSHSHGNTGDASTMPPYRSAYCWHRLA